MSETIDISPPPEKQVDLPALNKQGQEARDRLDQSLDRIETFVQEACHLLFASVREKPFETLFTALHDAADRHRQLLDTLQAVSGQGQQAAWEAVLAYRRGVEQHVTLPVKAVLDTSLEKEMEQRYQDFFQRLIDGLDWTPHTEVVPEDPTLYAAKDGDSSWRRLLKRMVRSRRKVRSARLTFQNGLRRLIRRKARPPIQYLQHVPLQALVQYHIQVRIPLCLVPIFESSHQSLTKPIAAYEHTLTSWTYQLLDAERALALPTFDFPALEEWIEKQDHPMQPVEEGIWQRIIEQAQALQKTLDEAATIGPAEETESSASWLDAVHEAFRKDVQQGGTRLLKSNDRALPPSPSLPASHIQDLTEKWTPWYEEMRHRLSLNALLIQQRDAMLNGHESLLLTISNTTILPILQSFNSLNELLDQTQQKARKICNEKGDRDDLKALVKKLKPLHRRISQEFKLIINDLSGLLRAGQELDEPGATLWKDLIQNARSMPTALSVHQPQSSLPLPFPRQKYSYRINLQKLVLAIFQESLPAQLRPHARALQKAVIHTWEETQQVEFMVDYNLNAAFDELEQKPEKNAAASQEQSEPGVAVVPTEETEEEQDPATAALELMTSGLARSSEKIADLIRALNKPWAEFVNVSFNILQKTAQEIHQDVLSEDNLQGPWTKLRIRIGRFIERTGQQIQDAGRRLRRFLGRLIRRGRRQTRQLIRKGQTAVGVVGQSEDQWLQTLQLVSDIDAMHKRLPLVYRRLFSLKPVIEPDLLEGRKQDIAFVKKHFERWQAGQTGPLILSMFDGSGRTSLINVLATSVFEKSDVQIVTLQKRITDPSEWVELIAPALGLKSDLSIDELEAELISRTRETTPHVVMIDQLEQLLMCIPSGDNLIERILIFLARTDNAVYWVVNISVYAWHFLEKTIRPSSGFITAYPVARLQRQSLEEIILKRHRRSGVNLHFKPVQSARRFFDFTRKKDEKTQQEALRQAFFERLFRLSGQNVLLALLYWLRSIEFDSEADLLQVNGIEPINFSFLDTLDLTRAFTLKSFLLHGSLTLEEHQRIFRSNDTESTFILESLLNLRIIEPSFPESQGNVHYRIVPDQAYHLHPLILHPVTELLKKMHIVY